MRRIFLCAIAVLSLTVLLSGCTFELKSVDSLIRAPKLTGNNAEIQRVFEAAAGTDVVLVSPSAGEYRTSYISVDYDNDSVDETIVFYSKKADELTVRVNFLDIINNEWVSVADVSTGGSEVYEMRLGSIDGDSIPEVLITWSVMDTNRYKYLTVFKVSDDNKKTYAAIATIQVDDYRVMDINVDGVSEIFYTYFESSTDEYLPFAAVQRYDNESKSFLQVGEAAINPLAVSFAAYSFDMKEGVNRIYIDCMRSDGLCFTELLCWDPDNSLLLAPLSENGNSATLTSRSSGVFCTDISLGGETDGLIEIPYEENPAGSVSVGDDAGIEGVVIIRTWYAYKDNMLTAVSKRYINKNDGYELLLNDMYGTIDIVQYENSGVTEVYSNIDGERGELLFTISAKPIQPTSADANIQSYTGTQKAEKEIIISVTETAKAENINEEYIRSLIIMN